MQNRQVDPDIENEYKQQRCVVNYRPGLDGYPIENSNIVIRAPNGYVFPLAGKAAQLFKTAMKNGKMNPTSGQKTEFDTHGGFTHQVFVIIDNKGGKGVQQYKHKKIEWLGGSYERSKEILINLNLALMGTVQSLMHPALKKQKIARASARKFLTATKKDWEHLNLMLHSTRMKAEINNDMVEKRRMDVYNGDYDKDFDEIHHEISKDRENLKKFRTENISVDKWIGKFYREEAQRYNEIGNNYRKNNMFGGAIGGKPYVNFKTRSFADGVIAGLTKRDRYVTQEQMDAVRRALDLASGEEINKEGRNVRLAPLNSRQKVDLANKVWSTMRDANADTPLNPEKIVADLIKQYKRPEFEIPKSEMNIQEGDMTDDVGPIDRSPVNIDAPRFDEARRMAENDVNVASTDEEMAEKFSRGVIDDAIRNEILNIHGDGGVEETKEGGIPVSGEDFGGELPAGGEPPAGVVESEPEEFAEAENIKEALRALRKYPEPPVGKPEEKVYTPAQPPMPETPVKQLLAERARRHGDRKRGRSRTRSGKKPRRSSRNKPFTTGF